MVDPSDPLSAILDKALATRYRIERKLGEGGMAKVYLAHDLRHGRRVALKVLRPEVASGTKPERFLAEIRTTATLHHPHILPLFDSGEAAGQVFYVMPYVDGESLQDRLEREGQLPVDEAVRIARAVAGALEHAHRQGVIHRDVKPGNILLQDGEPLVADFGISRALSEAGEGRLTETGLSLGTPQYMSPEQATGERSVDARTDVYALGAVLYQMLTGEPPHTGSTAQAVLAKVLTGEPRPVTELRRTVPPHVEAAISKALEKLPADRFRTVEAFGAALGEPGFRRAAPAAPPTGRKVRRRTIVAVALAVTIGLSLWLGPGLAQRVISALGAPGGRVDPELYAVFPFRVIDRDPALAYRREGMVDLLHQKLSSIRRSVEPRTLLDAWRRAGGGEASDLPLDASARIASRLAAGRVVLGSIVGSPQVLTLNASLYEAPSGDLLATASVMGRGDDLLDLVDELTAELLGLEAGEGAGRTEALTTTSLEALAAYLDGMSLHRRGLYREAAESFLSAVRQDDTFALAALYLDEANGMVARGVGGGAGGIVRANRDRLGPRDRLFSLAAIPDTSDRRSWIERWEAAVRSELADRADAWYRYGDALFHGGLVEGMENSLGRAKVAFDNAVALDSSYFVPLHHRVWIAAIEGDTAFVRQVATRYLESEQTGRAAEEFTLRLALLNRDTASVRRFDDNLESLSDDFLEVLTDAPRFARNEAPWEPDRARRAAAILLDRAATTGEQSSLLRRQYLLLLNLGRPKEADSILDVASRLSSTQALQHDRWRISAALFWDGNHAAAERAAERIARLSSPTPVDSYHLALWRLERGETTGVREMIDRIRLESAPRVDSLFVDILEARLAHVQGDAGIEDVAANLEANLLRGGNHQLMGQGNITVSQIFEALGDPRRALAAARRYGRGGDDAMDRFGPTFLRTQGRLAAALGLREEAIQAYTVYLSLRPDPEPELQPEVDQIRAEVARLKSELVAAADRPPR